MKKATAEPVLAYLLTPSESSRIWKNGTQISVYRLASSGQQRANFEGVFKRITKYSSLICHSQIIPAFDTPPVINTETVSINKDFLKIGVGDSGGLS